MEDVSLNPHLSTVSFPIPQVKSTMKIYCSICLSKLNLQRNEAIINCNLIAIKFSKNLCGIEKQSPHTGNKSVLDRNLVKHIWKMNFVTGSKCLFEINPSGMNQSHLLLPLWTYKLIANIQCQSAAPGRNENGFLLNPSTYVSLFSVILRLTGETGG